MPVIQSGTPESCISIADALESSSETFDYLLGGLEVSSAASGRADVQMGVWLCWWAEKLSLASIVLPSPRHHVAEFNPPPPSPPSLTPSLFQTMGLGSVISNTEAAITLFAPSDDAFERLLARYNIELSDILRSPETLKMVGGG
jgi:hypothetical protein